MENNLWWQLGLRIEVGEGDIFLSGRFAEVGQIGQLPESSGAFPFIGTSRR
jgi:hypothetical protein